MTGQRSTQAEQKARGGKWLFAMKVISVLTLLAVVVSPSAMAQDPEDMEALPEQVEDVSPPADQNMPVEPSAPAPPISVPPPQVVVPTPQVQIVVEPSAPPPIIIVVTPTASGAVAAPAPSAPLAPPGAAVPATCLSGTSVSVAKDPSFAGESLLWRAQGFAPGTFISYSLARATSYRRGDRAETISPNFRATVNSGCIAGAGYGDEYYPPATNPSGRYVLVVSGQKYPDRVDATNYVEFELVQTLRPTPRNESVGCFPRPC